ncbi:MAG: secretin and TonB N-terminal domain-containing protein [Labilithrix sp.]|nr:secretin and TonB N-terminal domain-containing protein [Labilithrix sp.]
MSRPVEPADLPGTAFRSDEELARPSEAHAPSRFETRRIGGERSEGRRFHGAPVDLDLKGADLQNVFRLLADVGHVNIVVDGDVAGTITLRLRRVPWDQALDVIARAKGLFVERDGNVIFVRAHAPGGARGGGALSSPSDG